MVRKILSGIWLVLCGSLFVLSLIGIITVWQYKQPLTDASSARLDELDAELGRAQTALKNAQAELERALRFVDSAEEALESFSEQAAVAREFLDTVTEVLDETIKPSLTTSRRKSCLRPGCSGTGPPLYQAQPLDETQKVWMTLPPMALCQATWALGSASFQAPGLAKPLRPAQLKSRQ